MSIIQSLYIGHANVSCTTEDIKNRFDQHFNEQLVSRVDERVKTDKRGVPFKLFFVHFDRINPALQSFFMKLNTSKTLTVKGLKVQFNSRYEEKQTDIVSSVKDDAYWLALAEEFH